MLDTHQVSRLEVALEGDDSPWASQVRAQLETFRKERNESDTEQNLRVKNVFSTSEPPFVIAAFFESRVHKALNFEFFHYETSAINEALMKMHQSNAFPIKIQFPWPE